MNPIANAEQFYYPLHWRTLITGGDAVYAARIMLNMDVEDNFVDNGNRLEPNHKNISTDFLSINPNPFKDFVEISINLNFEYHGQAIIYNMYSNKVAEFKISDLENNIYWYPKDLGAGVYFVKTIVFANNKIETRKIIIIK